MKSTWGVPLQKVSEEVFLAQAKRLAPEFETETLSEVQRLRNEKGRLGLYFGEDEANRILAFKIEKKRLFSEESFECHRMDLWMSRAYRGRKVNIFFPHTLRGIFFNSINILNTTYIKNFIKIYTNQGKCVKMD